MSHPRTLHSTARFTKNNAYVATYCHGGLFSAKVFHKEKLFSKIMMFKQKCYSASILAIFSEKIIIFLNSLLVAASETMGVRTFFCD